MRSTPRLSELPNASATETCFASCVGTESSRRGRGGTGTKRSHGADVFIARVRVVAPLRRGARPRGQGYPATRPGRPRRSRGGSQWTLEQAHRSPGSAEASPDARLVGGGPRASRKRRRGSGSHGRDDRTRAGARRADRRANHLLSSQAAWDIRDELRELVELRQRALGKTLTSPAAQGDLAASRRSLRPDRRAHVRSARPALGGEDLIDAGRRAEGEAEIEKALAFYRSVGATFFVERGERLLAKAQSASA